MHSWMVCGRRKGAVMEGRRAFAVTGAGRFWPAATVAAAARSWIEPPRVESLVCACRLFMVSSAFRCSRFGSAPLNRVAVLAGLSHGGRAGAVLDEHERG